MTLISRMLKSTRRIFRGSFKLSNEPCGLFARSSIEAFVSGVIGRFFMRQVLDECVESPPHVSLIGGATCCVSVGATRDTHYLCLLVYCVEGIQE